MIVVPLDLTSITALIDFADPRAAHGGDAAASAAHAAPASFPRMRYAFENAHAHIVAHSPQEVAPALDAVQAAALDGRWCVGYVRYEAASALDAALTTHAATGPLVWFAVYDYALPWPHEEPSTSEAPTDSAAHAAGDGAWVWRSALDRDTFNQALERIHAGITDGVFYQVNYTASLAGQWVPSPRSASSAPHSQPTPTHPAQSQALFAALQRAQPGGYAAWLQAGQESILSVSPELFFEWQTGRRSVADGALLARPMKGTAARGITPQADAQAAQALQQSPKERAENVMIVDLLRNDMSRIAQPHTVQVSHLLATQALPAVWQMTSDVHARTRANTTLAQVFGALFPCGSVTGAPKVQAMRAIADLEPQPRGVYCGALGVVHPTPQGVRAIFNVPIRTVVLTEPGASADAAAATDWVAHCGIGSGITSDAQPDAEWAEWAHKRAFLERASEPFDLLETLALEQGQYRHAALHLARMAQAAQHFGVPWRPEAVHACLHTLAQQHLQGLWRVRLVVSPHGVPQAQAWALQATPAPVRLQLAPQAMAQAHSEFTRFKTSRRAHYDALAPTDPGIFDTVLFNPQGEITECTRGNIAMQIGGQWVTPPLACGLLPGIGRSVALQEGRLSEAVVRVSDVPKVQAWAFINSLRGWLPASLWLLPRRANQLAVVHRRSP